jgi:hypothetical protein
MKFISTYSIRAGCWPEAASRFLSGQGQPPAGIKLLGRWHRCDGSGGWSLFEADDAAAIQRYSSRWSDVLEIHTHPVVEDQDAAAGLSERYGKPKKRR